MIELLQRVFRTVRDSQRMIDYEESKRILLSDVMAERRELAANEGVRAEVLYYLASDVDSNVRSAVAANEATPVQADLILARDLDDHVRIDLAGKIARLTPGLTAEQHQRLREITFEVLEILVRDQVVRVREVVAEVLKDVANAPPEVIRTLARDSELVVAGPVLQFSPVLTDDDLLEIIRGAPIPGALSAIAQRSEVRGAVADAIGAAPDVAAITALLENPSAQIREETLDRLLDRAPEHAEWHRPLVNRPLLPAKAAKKLARFVARGLLMLLNERRDLDAETAHAVKTAVVRRLDAEEQAKPRQQPTKLPPKTQVSEAVARARDLKATGMLNEAAVLSALGTDRAFARAALAVLGDVPVEIVDRMLSAHSAKGLTALTWKCGLSMRAAVKIQVLLAQIPPTVALKPRNGDAYPMSEEAMRWQLEFFGGMAMEAVRG